jgi:hypothetical protein
MAENLGNNINMAGYSAPAMRMCDLNCIMCPFVLENHSKDLYSEKVYNCNSEMTVYLITCDQCRQQYVGYCSSRLQDSYSFHLKEIEDGVTPFGQHFRQCGEKSMKIQVNRDC